MYRQFDPNTPANVSGRAALHRNIRAAQGKLGEWNAFLETQKARLIQIQKELDRRVSRFVE
jgi:hypothetical protein